jgi:CarD family transcriptional regulator
MEGVSSGGDVHSIGDLVVYRNNGIYRIIDIRNEKFFGIDGRTYYVLCSVCDKNSFVYIPKDAVDMKLTMRHILSRDDIDDAINKAENSSNKWHDDVRERTRYFDRLFDSGSCSDILWVFKVLSLYRDETENEHRRFYASDERLLDAAEKIIIEEFSFVLGIDKDEVVKYITDRAAILQSGKK